MYGTVQSVYDKDIDCCRTQYTCHTHIDTCTHTCTHSHSRTHTHTYTHTHHTHIHSLILALSTAELSRPAITDKRSRSTAAILSHGINGEISYSSKEIDMQLQTMASPRHFLRRGGMVQDQLQNHLCSSKLVQQVRSVYKVSTATVTYT